MIQRTLLVTAMIAASQCAFADDAVGASPTTVQNATASASPIRATTPATVDADEKSAARFRPRTAVKARIDDGRYNGFHQGGGDQPAGDQQLRPADRIQAETKLLQRKSGARAPTPAQTGSKPAERDQSTIVNTQ